MPLDVLLVRDLPAGNELFPGTVRIEALETREHRQVGVRLGVEILVNRTRGHEHVDNLEVVICAYIHDRTVVGRDPLYLEASDGVFCVVGYYLVKTGAEIEGDVPSVVELVNVACAWLLPSEAKVVDVAVGVNWLDFGNVHKSLLDVAEAGDNLL